MGRISRAMAMMPPSSDARMPKKIMMVKPKAPIDDGGHAAQHVEGEAAGRNEF